MLTARRKHIGLLLCLVVVFCGWYVCPLLTFGGTYIHVESSSRYRFADGRFYENGSDIGAYTVFLRKVTIDLKRLSHDEPVCAKIGWDKVDMPVPKYGQSRLMRRNGPDMSR